MNRQTKLFGEDSEPKVLTALELTEAKSLAAQIQEKIMSSAIDKALIKLELVGSIRRQKQTVGDIDFVVVLPDSQWNKLIACFRKSSIICAGNQQLQVNYPYDGNFFQADFYRAYEHNFGIQELIRTGSAEHNTWLAALAISKGLRLKYSQGLMQGESVLAGKTEESIFAALELPFVRPQDREVADEKPIWLKVS